MAARRCGGARLADAGARGVCNRLAAARGAVGRRGVTPRAEGRAPHLTGAAPAVARRTVDVDMAGDTPILREYRAVKEEHPDAIVLARLGDFYEMLGRDAELASTILGVALLWSSS